MSEKCRYILGLGRVRAGPVAAVAERYRAYDPAWKQLGRRRCPRPSFVRVFGLPCFGYGMKTPWRSNTVSSPSPHVGGQLA
jgi:hypothetical protein